MVRLRTPSTNPTAAVALLARSLPHSQPYHQHHHHPPFQINHQQQQQQNQNQNHYSQHQNQIHPPQQYHPQQPILHSNHSQFTRHHPPHQHHAQFYPSPPIHPHQPRPPPPDLPRHPGPVPHPGPSRPPPPPSHISPLLAPAPALDTLKSPSRLDSRSQSRKRDEEKKLRRAGILPSYIKPKSKPGPVISKAALEKRAQKMAAAAEAAAEAELQPKSQKPQPRQLAIPSAITVSQLAYLTHQKLHRLQALMQTAGLDDARPDRLLSSDDAAYLALESGYEPIVDDSLAFDVYPDPPTAEPDRASLPLRPPVVCIMGHVDHGKTTLLDALRSSAVAEGEAGGITQHIGAFEVGLAELVKAPVSTDGPQTITFLDTPGHAAFSAMRSRGALATDVAVVVVAADDGVKPQTEEVIGLLRQSDVGVVVAITKCDKPGVDLHRTRAGIYAAGLEIEALGGETPCVEVSAVSGQGLGALAETILAVAEVRELRAERGGVRFEGRVIEADVGRERGIVATVVALRGSLHVGLDLVAGCAYGRARQLLTVAGEAIQSITPGRPVQVSGWKQLPEAGSLVLGVESEELAKRAQENRVRRAEARGLASEIEQLNAKRAQARAAFASTKAELEGLSRRARQAHLRERDQQAVADAKAEGEGRRVLKLVVKADYTGTVEAVRTAVGGLGNKEVGVQIVSSGVGNVTESDVGMAVASGGMIIGFNVGIDRAAYGPLGTHKVECQTESVIYRLVEQVTEKLIEKLPSRFEERVYGQAKILEIFEISIGKGKQNQKRKVAGCKVFNGEMKKNGLVKIVRGLENVWQGKLTQLKQGKKDSEVVLKGSECGIGFEEEEQGGGGGLLFEGFEVGDLVVGFERVRISRRLDDGL